MRTYRIKDGASFRVDEVTVKYGGELIELEDDVAVMHAGRIDLAPDAAVTGETGQASLEH